MRRVMLTTIGIPLAVANTAGAFRSDPVARCRKQGERGQILRFVQPSLVALIDGTISTPASIFAALKVAYVVVAMELIAIAWVRRRFVEVPLHGSLVQVTMGGSVVAAVGVLIGHA